jgi:hypothetical protein
MPTTPGIVEHPGAQEAEVGGESQVPGQPGLQRKPLFQKTNRIRDQVCKSGSIFKK